MKNKNSHLNVTSISKSWHDSSEMFGKNFWQLVGLVLIPSVLTYLLGLAAYVAIIYSISSLNSFYELFYLNNFYSIVLFLCVILAVLCQMIEVIALTYFVIHYRTCNILDAFTHAWKYFLKFLGLGVAFVIIAGVSMLIGYLIVALIGIIVGEFSLELVGQTFSWINTIPIVITAAVSVYFIFAGLAVVDDKLGTLKSLKMSCRLVHGYFWPTALRVLLVYAVVSILTYALGFIPKIGTVIAVCTLTPFTMVYLSIIYQNLKTLKHNATELS
ncbi:MAG: hypothetical protein A2233_04150 [Candidatus Kerfeldbacteria bacterium RIFOXYA2_FULL_38_24]|uniref:Glycerophosphoryl diester phosphodiesterase membrane domain-containing protein n=1 Tax=Candidatus Kerfeldbacteria bacterium RIFOXYB2_FULL_38_14 TaxID=1798547 RepID=A0A1G2BEY0_9BACT|nr:MAG: hypothetical protein A2233_04150 [Candidatus Kerfeldbacteria bacterium RIFOXYA2_FULL_38_24]OGY86757.1 MAG: hypothetical protein A2319_00880 [Candidatus Kerfeldbacteria bacterium RIFOXYB2_FULL_38_14]